MNMDFVRKIRDDHLKQLVDPKICEAFANGKSLSNEWKKFRQDLLDITKQNVKSFEDLKWPTKPE